MSMNLDDVIRNRYRKQSRAVDEILCDPQYAAIFAEGVVGDCQSPVAQTVVLKRLITLRKRGEKKDGLPQRRPR